MLIYAKKDSTPSTQIGIIFLPVYNGEGVQVELVREALHHVRADELHHEVEDGARQRLRLGVQLPVGGGLDWNQKVNFF